MLTLDSGACNVIPFTALGDPKAVREGSRRYVRLPSGKIARVVALNGVWITEIGMFEYTTQTLPPVTGLPEGTEIFISDCNGNIARLVNGAWRYISPFIVAWASRPAANTVPVGTEIQVTDYANQKWVSDGTVWRPAQGRVLIGQQYGKVSQPLATLNNTAQGYFTIPGGNPRIKAGMIVPNSRVYLEALTRKDGAGGPAGFYARLARVGASFPDATFATMTIGNTNLNCSRFFSTANFGTAKTQFLTPQYLAPAASAVGSTVDKSSQINTDEDMEVAMSIASANTADTFLLFGYSIWLEA